MDDKLGNIHTNVKSVYLSEIGRLSEAFQPAAEAIAAHEISVNRQAGYGDNTTLEFVPEALRSEAITASQSNNATIASTYQDITQSKYAKSGGDNEMVKRGWGAAGLWYTTLGTINGLPPRLPHS